MTTEYTPLRHSLKRDKCNPLVTTFYKSVKNAEAIERMRCEFSRVPLGRAPPARPRRCHSDTRPTPLRRGTESFKIISVNVNGGA
ncbi:hypothetical protein EVAR_5972_1 [Eumeta japonica]|uniref:Uncharacterized protein n=1 Tax=Eumeta variegata TaxID=151549 RepID=A0A4C1TCA9_EUMVA|nr:hypothetical protein EVAR_5972_1 [Eumeta japonica]